MVMTIVSQRRYEDGGAVRNENYIVCLILIWRAFNKSIHRLQFLVHFGKM